MPPHRRDNTTPTARVSDRFGGMADLARALGIDPSAVRHWQVDRGGNIPPRWHPVILAAAKRAKVRVSKRDMADV